MEDPQVRTSPPTRELSLSTAARDSISLRLLMMMALSALLMIPSAMIGDLVREREHRRSEAISEVGSKWGEPQLVSGPVLHVPYQQHWTDEKGKVHVNTVTAHFLPESLDLTGTLESQIRYRGIFEVILYTAALEANGSFEQPRFDEWGISAQDVLWDRAFLTVGITDGRGIREEIRLEWAGGSHRMRPRGDAEGGILSSVMAGVPLQPSSEPRSYPFSFRLKLNGHNYLKVLPVGKSTRVTLSGDWGSPSFQGAFLPEQRSITARGFTAEWRVLDLNRSFPQQWRNEQFSFDEFAFGVDLLVPVDGYQKTTRAQKYALMFVGLTFLVLFFAELVKKRRVHPFQYVLIGLAICLFYLLLLSISEHLDFDKAYLIASAAITVLAALYSKQVFRSAEFSATLGGFFALLYAYLFILLQLKDYALLVGSMGLFVVLAGVMYFSGRISWYPERDANG